MQDLNTIHVSFDMNDPREAAAYYFLQQQKHGKKYIILAALQGTFPYVFGMPQQSQQMVTFDTQRAGSNSRAPAKQKARKQNDFKKKEPAVQLELKSSTEYEKEIIDAPAASNQAAPELKEVQHVVSSNLVDVSCSGYPGGLTHEQVVRIEEKGFSMETLGEQMSTAGWKVLKQMLDDGMPVGMAVNEAIPVRD